MRKSDGTFRSGFVTVIGRPNVGKSTLVNRFLGTKVAIVSDKPQTTRNRINAILTGEDYQIIFIDTPGIHRPHTKLGELMVKAAEESLEEVDAILFVVDASAGVGGGDLFIADRIRGLKEKVILIANKLDEVGGDELEEVLGSCRDLDCSDTVIPVSAKTGENMDRLLGIIIGRLPEGPKYYPDDMIVDYPERYIVSEIIREKILQLTEEEVPHSVFVEVTEMKERPGNEIIDIRADIYTEKDSQKGIIIGGGGSMLKKIGSLAREDIEKLLGSKVFLDIWVKVKKGWRKDENALRRFGFK